MTLASALRAPLTGTQRDVFLDQQLHGELPLHRIGASVGLGSELDRHLWEEAVARVFAAEPIMRSRIETSQTGLYQCVDDGASMHVEFHDGVAAGGEALRDWLGKRLQRAPSDRAPFRHVLVRTADGEFHTALGGPHVFSDGHSYRLFFERVGRCYEALLEGNSRPEPAPTSFYDYVDQRPLVGDDPAAFALWQARLDGMVPLQFRTRREVPGEYRSVRLLLSTAVTEAVTAFCRAQRVGLATFFLALQAVVVQRLREPSGDWAVHVIRGRRPRGFRDTMGCFFDVLPYRMPEALLRRSARLPDLFSYVRSYPREPGLRHNLSMLRLQECLPAGGCRAVYNFYNFERVRVLGQTRTLETYISHPPREAQLIVSSRDERIELRYLFHTSETSDQAVLERMRRLASQVAGGADRIADLDWLLEGEQPPVREASSVAAPAQTRKAVHELFEEQAAQRPHATALVMGDNHWTYEALNRYANRLARLLVREGVSPGTLVALYLDRSFEQVAAVLAVLKAGGAYVPIDPEYPAARARFILQDSGAKLVVTDTRQSLVTAGTDARMLRLDEVAARLDDADASNLGSRAGPGDLAYVIYTSGSTGQPKGVMVTHDSVASLFLAARKLFDFDARDVWPLLHSYAFDFSVWELWGALAFGGRLVIVPSCVVRSPEDVWELLIRQGITILNQTPSAFYRLMEAERQGDDPRPTALRWIVFGGEMLDIRRLRAWFDRRGDSQPTLVNMYGITETTVHVTWRRLRREDSQPGRPSVIGRPLPGSHVYVVDDEGQLVPRGVAGELWVGGGGVARGYLGRDDLTAARFVRDPFATRVTERVYRSGDLVRELEDGDLEYIGRLDNQVQIRGYRVEPGEIESVLRQHPGVADAAVVAHAGSDGELGLVAYIVRAAGSSVGESLLREHLRCRLPAYMGCARYCFLPALPLTAHGKIDWAALPAPDGDRPDLSVRYVPPRTQVEELLAEVFAEVTGIEHVGIDDDFFALGGNSLSATQMVARLRQVLGVELPLSVVFEAPTVAALAEATASGRFDREANAAPQVVHAGAGDDRPLTFAQERVWLIQQLHPHVVAYHFEARLEFRGELRVALLGRCLQELVQRHEVLRTTFPVVDGRPVQRVHPSATPAFDIVSLEHLPADEARLHVETWRRQSAGQPLALDRLPLVRWTLFRLSAQEHVLVHREHHLLHDGWSFIVLVGELLRAYRDHLDGKASTLPALPLRLSDVAYAEREWVRGPSADRQLAYWRRQLSGAPPSLELPADFARPPRPTYRGDALRVELPDDLVASLRDMARGQGVTLFMAMLAAFAVLVARFCGEPDVCIGSGVANRRRPEVEGIVGMLLNNVILRIDLRAEPSFAGVLKQVRRVVLEALANQDLPFDRVARLLRAEGDPVGAPPVCPIFFSSYEGPTPHVPIPGLAVDVEAGLPNGSAKFDLNVIVVVQPRAGFAPLADAAAPAERVTLIWEYSTDLFERAAMQRMVEHYLYLLGGCAADPHRLTDDLELASASDVVPVTKGPTGSAAYRRDASVVDLWLEQVAQSPDAVAVRDVHGAWTYRQTQVVAGQLACLLLERGVQPEELVGILLPRGRAAVACMLGILQAGAAYLPLDPRDPARRIAWLAAETGLRFVLTYASMQPLLHTCAGLEPLCLDELESDLAGYGEVEPPRAARAESLAYVMFTSGSTGSPKGVEIVHRGIVRLVAGVDYARLDRETRILQLAPLSFDASTFEIWGALLHGGTLSVYQADVPDVASLGQAIAEADVNTMWLNASLFNTIVDQNPTVLAPLEQLLIGGEALSVQHVRRAYAHLERTQIVNGYGPTENTTFSCCYPIPRDLPPGAPSIPIGRAIAHSSAYVLDDRQRPAPWGVVGEIYLGGDGVARGYRSHPERTAQRFVPDPFAAIPGARMYRSGDLGRLRADGTLEFRGRRDDQLKVRGLRIEPAEVAWAIERLEGVRQCAVVARTEERSDLMRLVAYVVPETGAAVDPDRLRAAARLELPAYLVPQEFVLLDALPRSPNGKLDRAALPQPPPRARPSAPPRNATEEIIAGLMADVLGVEEVGAQEHFFDLGGHSLLGLELLARLCRVLAVDMPVRALLENPSAAELARIVGETWTRCGDKRSALLETVRSLVRIKPGGSKPPLFFTPGGDGGAGALLVYARLARFIDADQPFFGLRRCEGARPHHSVETMAAAYLAEVKQVQPRGPYVFAGECVGGVIAYEMARQAIAAGDEVGSLILLDSRPPGTASYVRHWLRYISAVARRWADDALGPAAGSASGDAAGSASGDGRVGGTVEQAKRWFRCWLDKRLPYDAREAPPTIQRAWVDYQRTLLRYRPRPYPGKLSLLLSEHYALSNVSRSWQRLVRGGVEVYRTHGDHDSYIRAHARTTARILDACLEGARTDVRKPAAAMVTQTGTRAT